MRKTKIKILLLAGASGLMCLVSLSRVVHAETIITDGYLDRGAVWSAENSPYIIESPIRVPADRSLVIGPGTTVIGSSTIEGYNFMTVNGSLTMKGNVSKPILLSGFGGVTISGGDMSMDYTEVRLPEGVSVFNGLASVSNSTISGSTYEAIRGRSSTINISDSRIAGNKYGVFIESSAPPGIFPVRGDDQLFGIGGIGNALSDNSLAEVSTPPTVSIVTITNSDIVNNTSAAIKNADSSIIQAQNNWWGSESGPNLSGQNSIIGSVDYDPWLRKDPLENKPVCCSSVLFIPGLEGSRLYRDEKMPVIGSIIGSTTNRLWEPNRNADVKKLYLNADGSSTDQTIYSGQPIGSAMGLYDIYGKFMNNIQDLVRSGQISEWKAFGYDWRQPIAEVVAGSEKKATTTESLIQTVTDLASRSKTGKVSIVAHSNGGLVAKYLVKTLTDLGKADLIDSVISVAVPYLGTPEAIAGLLHGDGQDILGGWVLSKSVARGLAQNMASAYSLLPSREYFSKVFGPTIAFASTTINSVNNGAYSQSISSYEDQASFIADSKNARVIPKSSDVSLPIVGNDSLMLAADLIHGILDPFSWPASITRWSIIGWNRGTAKGIEYHEKTSCSKSGCVKEPVVEKIKTIMGDGVVVAPSAAYNAGTVISEDLDDLSSAEKSKIAHDNILGASSTAATIDKIITHNPADDQKSLIEEISKIPGITIGEPDYSHEPSFLVVSTHSPVELHVYDSQGRHTGIIPKPTNTDEEIEDGLFTFTETNIPGSEFDNMGGTDEDPEYQIYLPDDKGEKYTIVMNGTGIGEFTFDAERFDNGSSVGKVEFANMPVTPLTIATTTVLAGIGGKIPDRPLASTTAILSIDIDGNGAPDVQATPETKIDDAQYFKLLRDTISNSFGKLSRGKNIISRIDKIQGLIKKGKIMKAHKVSDKLYERVSHMKLKKLAETDKTRIMDLIELYVSQYE